MKRNTEGQPGQSAPGAPETSQIPAQPSPVATATKADKPRLSRLRRFFRKLLIWLVVVAATFLAGIITDQSLRYKPLSEAFLKSQASMDQANQNINDLTAQTGQLNTLFQVANDKVISLEGESNALQDELGMATAHVELLQVLMDVSNARLALSQKDVEGAKTALVNTQQRLDDLLPRIAKYDSNLAKSMPQRLGLIASGLDRDTETAKIDLDLFAKDILKIETVMFGG